MRGGLGLLGAIWILLLQGPVWAADPVAVLTEIRMGRGEVQVKRAGGADWQAPQPLLALRPGDQVRATRDSQAVLVFTGARGTQVVSQGNSPFTVQAPAAETGSEKLRALVAGVTQFLLAQQKELTYQSLSVRSIGPQPPLILSPRETRILAGGVTFEWAGSDLLRYRIRVFGPHGLLWEQGDLRRHPLSYPASAPALSEGMRYLWELEAPGYPVQRAPFELLVASEAAQVQAALALLEPATLSGYPRGTVLLMRAGLLAKEGLYHEARRELLAALAADPDEPTLHLLLGQVYEQTGLKHLAAREFEEAQFLSTRKP